MSIALVNTLQERVKELIRHGEIDLTKDPYAVQEVIENNLDALINTAGQVSSAAVLDKVGIVKKVFDEITGLGPIQLLLDDPNVEEIWINSPTQVFVSRNGNNELTNILLTKTQLQVLVEQLLAYSGRRIDMSSPFVDAALPSGERVHIVIPDITREHCAINIRKFVLKPRDLGDLVRCEMLSLPVAQFLTRSIQEGKNVLVTGGTQAGKTTFLNALTTVIPSNNRIITAEEVFELSIKHRDVVAMQCRQASLEGSGEVPLRKLVIEALRMRPDRLIIGEVRGAECLDLLLAMNSGIPALATLHANSARAAIQKVMTLPLLAGENVTSSFVLPTVASSVDLVVHLKREASGKRIVNEVVALSGRMYENTIETTQVATYRGNELVLENLPVYHGTH